MMEYTLAALEKLRDYMGESWQLALFAAAILYLLFRRKERKTRPLLAWYSFVFLVIYFCPLTAKIIMDYCVGRSVYWRMLWLLPVPLVIGYAGTRFVMRFSGTIARLAAGVLLAACIAFSGTCVYAPSVTPYVRAQNINKIPVATVDVCNQINQYCQGAHACVTAPYEMISYIRQYDASIELTYGRRGHGRYWETLFAQMTSGDPDFRSVAWFSRSFGANFLVYPSTEEQHREILDLGYEQIGSHDQYRIYFDTKNPY